MAQQALDKPNPYNTPINHSSLLLNPSTLHPSFGGAGGGPHSSFFQVIPTAICKICLL
ncbi:hypothetical protein HMPREF1475_00662 [Hoylesella oralis HGA0225]|nr:hypothetical protein HMPREF1475_00662 [Hoylesella oralis HGA0225]SHF75906.1 hypothetical protein SAMN05444288_1452 [Hoylesella oralis]